MTFWSTFSNAISIIVKCKLIATKFGILHKQRLITLSAIHVGALKMREWKMQEWKIQERKRMESRQSRK